MTGVVEFLSVDVRHLLDAARGDAHTLLALECRGLCDEVPSGVL
jgi:hypothetical protein